MKLASSGGIKIYNLSEGKSLPDWLSEKKKRALRKDSEFQRRIELIQDFEFRAASSRIKVSVDGQFIIASGTYPPMIKCYDTKELSEKFKRHLDCEVVQFNLLSGDWTKMALLEADRTVEVHASYGTHFKTRIPRFGRDMVYNQVSCDLLIGGVSNEIYRLNLDQGRFMEPFVTQATAVNVVRLNPVHNLLGIGTQDGTMESWDPRSKKPIAMIDIKGACVDEGASSTLPLNQVEVSSLQFDSDGLTLAVGTSNGYCLVYDLRSSRPVLKKLHQNEMPIRSINFHNSPDNKLILSADPKVIKIWNSRTGDAFGNVETPSDINDVTLVDRSGLILVATEQPRVLTYFIPSLGPAPKWSSFLESLTEELEEEAPSMYDDFKFVTRDELDAIGLSHMIGTDLLRAYMHGFFMDQRLYSRLKLVSDPFTYDTYRKERVEEKVKAKVQERITFNKRLPKVNKDMAERLLSTAKGKKAVGDDEEGKIFSNPIGDNRFADLFKSKDFEIDETSAEFQLRYPQGLPKKRNDDDDDEVIEQFDHVDDEESEEEGRGEDESSNEDDDEEEEEEKEEEEMDTKGGVKRKRFYELKDGSALPSLSSLGGTDDVDDDTRRRKKLMTKKSLGDRLKSDSYHDDEVLVRSGGMKEMTFEYEKNKRRSFDFDKKRKKVNTNDEDEGRRGGGGRGGGRGGFRGRGGGGFRGGGGGRGGSGGRGRGGRGGGGGGRGRGR